MSSRPRSREHIAACRRLAREGRRLGVPRKPGQTAEQYALHVQAWKNHAAGSDADEIKALAPSMPTDYLRRFFAEADIPSRTFTVVGPSGPNQIPNAVVVEHIARVGRAEATKIGDTLRRIDFANGDVNHYLEHLAGAIAR